jgi:hypothetical protein
MCGLLYVLLKMLTLFFNTQTFIKAEYQWTMVHTTAWEATDVQQTPVTTTREPLIHKACWYVVTFQHCITEAPGLHLIWVTCYIHWEFCGYSVFFQRIIGIVPWNTWLTPSNSLPPCCILIHCQLICDCRAFAIKTMSSVALKTEQSIHHRTARWN